MSLLKYLSEKLKERKYLEELYFVIQNLDEDMGNIEIQIFYNDYSMYIYRFLFNLIYIYIDPLTFNKYILIQRISIYHFSKIDISAIFDATTKSTKAVDSLSTLNDSFVDFKTALIKSACKILSIRI